MAHGRAMPGVGSNLVPRCRLQVELVWRDPRAGRYECIQYEFRLPKAGRVAHLITSLRAAVGIPKDTRVQVATVYGGKFNKLRGSTRSVVVVVGGGGGGDGVCPARGLCLALTRCLDPLCVCH